MLFDDHGRITVLCLVVDASVAATAGNTSQEPYARYCRSTLDRVLANDQYHVVLSYRTLAEWGRHQRQYAKTWMAAMLDQDRVHAIKRDYDTLLTRKITTRVQDLPCRKAMLKDRHLIRAARSTDGRVIAVDNNARKMFHQYAPQIPELRNVLWANPTVVEEEIIQWLDDGAPAEPRRYLGCLVPYFIPRQD